MFISENEKNRRQKSLLSFCFLVNYICYGHDGTGLAVMQYVMP